MQESLCRKCGSCIFLCYRFPLTWYWGL